MNEIIGVCPPAEQGWCGLHQQEQEQESLFENDIHPASSASSVCSGMHNTSSSVCSMSTATTAFSNVVGDGAIKECRIRVVARIRPLRRHEVRSGCRIAIHPLTDARYFKNTSPEYPTNARIKQQPTARVSKIPSPFTASGATTPANTGMAPRLSPFSPSGRSTRKSNIPLPSRSPLRGVREVNRSRDSVMNAPPASPAYSCNKSVSSVNPTSRTNISGSSSLIAGTENRERFDFHAVLKDDASQKEVYECAVGKTLRQNLAKGFNTTIIAMGQNESGKSFTMSGGWKTKSSNASKTGLRHGSFAIAREDGILPRAIYDMFKAKQRHEMRGDVTIEMSFLEVVDSHIFDLISDDAVAKELDAEYTPEHGVHIHDITRQKVESPTSVKKLMADAFRKRSQKLLQRGHLICEFQVQFHPPRHGRSNSPSAGRHAKLTLVNMAGDEELVDCDGFQEVGTFSPDLQAMEEVMDALHDEKRMEESVPYSATTLTRLLQDALGGNSYTILLACLSPSDESIEASMETLEIARKASNVTNMLRQNVGMIIKPRERQARILFEERSSDSDSDLHLEEDDEYLDREISTPQKPSPKSEFAHASNRAATSSRGPQQFSYEEETEQRAEMALTLKQVKEELKITKQKLANETAMTDKLGKLRDTLKKRCSVQDVEILDFKSQIQGLNETIEDMGCEIRGLRFELAGEKRLRSQIQKFQQFCAKQVNIRSLENNSLRIECGTKKDILPVVSQQFFRQQLRMASSAPKLLTQEPHIRELPCGPGAMVEILAQNSSEIAEVLEQSDLMNYNLRSSEEEKQGIEFLGDEEGNLFEDNNSADDSVSTSDSLDSSQVNDSDSNTESNTQHSPATNRRAIRKRAQKMIELANDAIKRQRSYSSGTEGESQSRKSEVTTMTQESKNKAVLAEKRCICQSPFMTGGSQYAEFFLPQLSVACTCGERKKDLSRSLEIQEILQLSNILRPWQVEFLKQTFDVDTAGTFVELYDNDGDNLINELRRWRRRKNFTAIRGASCGVAVHIWARTCKGVVWSCEEQRARGINKPHRPEFLEVAPLCAQTLSTMAEV